MQKKILILVIIGLVGCGINGANVYSEKELDRMLKIACIIKLENLRAKLGQPKREDNINTNICYFSGSGSTGRFGQQTKFYHREEGLRCRNLIYAIDTNSINSYTDFYNIYFGIVRSCGLKDAYLFNKRAPFEGTIIK